MCTVIAIYIYKKQIRITDPDIFLILSDHTGSPMFLGDDANVSIG